MQHEKAGNITLPAFCDYLLYNFSYQPYTRDKYSALILLTKSTLLLPTCYHFFIVHYHYVL